MKFPEDIDELCVDATCRWGAEAQEAVAVGEVGELLTMFGRRAQGRDNHEAWIDEIADVLIMMHQLSYIHGREEVEKRVAEKIEKIKKRLS